MAYGAGLRRFEIAALSLANYDPRNVKLTVQRGKGNKERTVSLPNGTVDALNRWITIRDANINTTAAYDRRGIRAQEQAAQTIHVPYQRPPE